MRKPYFWGSASISLKWRFLAMAVRSEFQVARLLNEVEHYQSLFSKMGFQPNSLLYDIQEPFKMDSQTTRMNREANNTWKSTEESTEEFSAEAKKGKRPHVDSANLNNERLVKECKLVESAHEQLFSIDTTSKAVVNGQLTNNSDARSFVKTCEEQSLSILCNPKMQVCLEPRNLHSAGTIRVGTLCQNGSSNPLVVSFAGSRFLIPERSQFILSDVRSAARELALSQRCFDIIVLDPPWSNKSVKRQKTYTTESEDLLLKLPLEKLLNKDGLVAIWVTNSPKIQDFLYKGLFPKWGLKEIARWHWLKITKSNEPVCSFDRPDFKVPFETLIFARKLDAINSLDGVAFPPNAVFASVPCAVASRKPPLKLILPPTVHHQNCQVLELFARYLQPNTLSVGNEVIKLQNLKYFQRCS